MIVLFVVLALSGLAWLAIIIALLARAILSPPRMTDGRATYLLHRLSPGDLGLDFENENFVIRDARDGKRLHIAGWWMPGRVDDGHCAILLHGYGDAKVGSIAVAPLLHRLGLNVLAIDLRAHGESGGSHCTAGFFERDDVCQIIDQLLVNRPRETQQIILVGTELGATVAAATAAQRDDVAAVVLDSPFVDYRQSVTSHADLIGMPRGPILQLALAYAEFISGAKFDQVCPTDIIAKLQCPVLLVATGDVNYENKLANFLTVELAK